MCLKEIRKIRLHKNYGWQVFRIREGNLLPFYMHKLYAEYGKAIPTGIWEKDLFPSQVAVDGDFVPWSLHQRRYISGFHIFLRKKDAEQLFNNAVSPEYAKNFTIKKVYFRNVITTGYQQPNKKWPIVVAAERFVED